MKDLNKAKKEHNERVINKLNDIIGELQMETMEMEDDQQINQKDNSQEICKNPQF